MGRTKKIISAEEACEILGMRFGSWRARMWSYHRGVPAKKWDARNGERPRHHGPWMPTPLKGGYSSRVATFKLADILYLYSEWYSVQWDESAEGDSVDLDKNEQKRLHAACELFGVAPPKTSTDPIDLDGARRALRKEINTTKAHPDQFMHDPTERQAAEARLRSLNDRFAVLVEHNNRIDVYLTGT